ncbi:MAG: hypothetical protein R3195_15830 [Gemmatimonadota bacterium]|nr:hypothetical protein [Gemmatimonadota bacterium]
MIARLMTLARGVFLALLAGLLVVACSDDTLVSPEQDPSVELDLHDLAPDAQMQALRPATLVLERNTARLMSRPGVVATAVGLTDAGRPAIRMYVDGPVLDDTPSELGGLPVLVVESGPIVALQEAQERPGVAARPGPPCPPKCDDGGDGGNGGNGGGGGSFSPTAKHRPAPNGVSLGHPAITAGTLGAIVTKGGNWFILSNNHVLADENLAEIGDDAYQPGRFDDGTENDDIGTLSAFVEIEFSLTAANLVDAAIASVSPADVTGETEPGSYGAPRTTTVQATVGQRVMKYGRTTGETKGRVQAVNATVNVGYDSGVARFVGQIIIGGGGFSAGGDSGSLIVVQNGSDARSPVGLLFAGGNGITVANPIDDVLEAFGVTIVGN